MIPDYNIPQELLDLEPTMSFQWCRKSCMGDETLSDVDAMEKVGWRVVKEGPIFNIFKYFNPFIRNISKDGFILMERPWKLTRMAQQEDYDKAMELKRSVSHMEMSNGEWNNRYHESHNGVSFRFTDKGVSIHMNGDLSIEEVKEKLEYLLG